MSAHLLTVHCVCLWRWWCGRGRGESECLHTPSLSTQWWCLPTSLAVCFVSSSPVLFPGGQSWRACVATPSECPLVHSGQVTLPLSPPLLILYFQSRSLSNNGSNSHFYSISFTLHLSPRLCPSPTGCSPPSMPSTVHCLLLSCFRCDIHKLAGEICVY